MQSICDLDLKEFLARAKAPASPAEAATEPAAEGVSPEEGDTIDQLLWRFYRSASAEAGGQFGQHSNNIKDLHLQRRAKELIRASAVRLYEHLSETSDKRSLPHHGPAPPDPAQFRMLLYG